MAAPRRVHYVLSSHWDREWYQPFQIFRYRLVELLDQVLAALENGSLVGPFFCDGQSVMIADYLEIRPEKRPLVEEFARTGKLILGPWYAAPDEFAVSGEALIRNLQLGCAYARWLGASPSAVGFSCDTFGHISQLPQIYAEFDIPAAFIWRGTNFYARRHVIWEGADGTALPAFRFGTNGYWGYFVNVRGLEDPPFDRTAFDKNLSAFIHDEAAHTVVDPIFLFDGADHQGWNPEEYQALAAHFEQESGGFEIVHSSPAAYLREMLPQTDRILPRLHGELLEPAEHPFDIDQQGFPQGVWSSRVWLKQENAANQARLCHWAEPFTALANAFLQAPVPQSFLSLAWKKLIENHAHDSIGGCSIDEVHADMQYRNRQVAQIADHVTETVLKPVAASIGEPVNDEVRLVIFNPLPIPLNEVVDLRVPIPADWQPEANTPPPAPHLQHGGALVSYQLDGWQHTSKNLRTYFAKAAKTYDTHDALVSLPLELPPMGYTTLTCLPTASEMRLPQGENIALDEHTLENEFLRVEVAENGSLTLTDKRNHQRYWDLLAFEDCADLGSGYHFKPAAGDTPRGLTAFPVDAAILENGPFKASLRLRQTMALPAAYDFETEQRATTLVTMTVESTLTLRQGADRLEVETRLHNPAKDHRLRVIFPTGVQTDTYLAETAFDVVEREIALPPNADQWREIPQETKPQQSWTAVHNGPRGLAVVTAGLLETAVRDLPERPIALTLFRATRHLGNLMPTPEETNGQALREMAFRYWIVPLTGAPDRVRLCSLGQQILAGFRTAAIQPADLGNYRGAVQLPQQASLIRVFGSAVVTSTRMVDDALEIRLFNPETEVAEIALDWSGCHGLIPPITHAQRVNLDGREIADSQPVDNSHICLTVNPKEIMTIRLMS